MSSELRSNMSERQNLMTGRVIPATKTKKTNRRFPIHTQELTNGPQRRNWKGLLLSLLVIAIVCVIVGISAWLLQPPEQGKEYNFTYSYESMFDIAWKPISVKGKWIGDSFVYQNRDMEVIRRTGDNFSQVLISNRTLESLKVFHYSVSSDLKYALLAYDYQQVYRHSSTAKYYVYSIGTSSHVLLHRKPLRYAAWGSTGNQIIYVLNSDLYYKKDVNAFPQRITDTGEDSDGNIFNGIADWIYEEEMLASTVANWMSPSGTYLAYASFNDTMVQEIDIVVYAAPYPEVKKIKYPKAGTPNPIVGLFVYDLATNEEVRIRVPEALNAKDVLLNSVVWATDDSVLVTWSNRYQNISDTLVCDVMSRSSNFSATCRKVHDQVAYGWIQYIGRPPVVGSSGVYFQIQEEILGGSGAFHHLLMVDYSTNITSTAFLTSGKWEVTNILGYEESSNRVYFEGNRESPGHRHVYFVQAIPKVQNPECVTCGLSCDYATGSLPRSPTEMFIRCLGPEVPFYAMMDLEGTGQTILENNSDLREKLTVTKLPRIVHEKVTITDEHGSYELDAKLYMPTTYVNSKFPLLVQVYGGPGSQLVDSRFDIGWKTYLSTNNDIAVLTFDGRGSGFKGSQIMKAVNRNLGNFEIEDQITAIKQVLKKHPQLDGNKVGIWGWSYGGYVSAMVASHPVSVQENLIKCAISVAPVTDWSLYDTIYTERYMGSPSYNHNKYMQSSLLSKHKSFHSFKYLLVHGTRDDNVHFQNSAILERELVREGVVHRYQVYTDETHSLASDATWTQKHLYKLMNEFLKNCFDQS